MDEFFDEEIKNILAKKENGANMMVDLIAHFEYFYNTLDCAFITENPFKSIKSYPALTCEVKGTSN